jgi:hypothetical protein
MAMVMEAIRGCFPSARLFSFDTDTYRHSGPQWKIVVDNQLWYKSAPFGCKSPLGRGFSRPPGDTAEIPDQHELVGIENGTEASAFLVSKHLQALK